ncbi:MAG: hypothetical protein IID28_05500 [Planctomycetes bacterium]|nr:hypothetical protein [Planctomycetota bacterium]
MLFTGKNELSIDSKQRMAIPAKTRTMLERGQAGTILVIVWGPNGVLWLWPERTFKRISGECEPTLTPSDEEMEHDVVTFGEAERLDIDSAGRIRLPQELLAEAELGDRVLLVGVRHHMEIWVPDEWAAQRREKAGRRREIAQRLRDVGRDGRTDERGSREP